METSRNQVVQVRQVQGTDIDEISWIEQECFKDPYPKSLFAELAIDDRDTFIVATVQDKIVGYAVARRGVKRHHLLSIAVTANYRNIGVGHKLLSFLESRLGYGVLELELRNSNTAALLLYQKIGFSTTGRISRYYRDGEDAVTMEKMLHS